MQNRREPIVPFSEFDVNQVMVDKEGVQELNPHRFEMQLIDGILCENLDNWTSAGYKDVTEDEFWVRGHMPDYPLMPGVIMCETAAQLSSYFCIKHQMLESNLVGMGGMDDVRVRAPVRPGDKFIVMVHRMKLRPRILVNSYFQGWVNEKLCVDGFIKGVRLD